MSHTGVWGGEGGGINNKLLWVKQVLRFNNIRGDEKVITCYYNELNSGANVNTPTLLLKK